MIIELFIAGSTHPPLYDAFIDRQGNLFGMSPLPRVELEDLMQVVLEEAPRGPTRDQKGAIEFLMELNEVKACYLFQEAVTASGPICSVRVYDKI